MTDETECGTNVRLNELLGGIGDYFALLRDDPAHHIGLGDVRLTIAQQDALTDRYERMYKLASRYMWLRSHYASADFQPRDHPGMDLVFSVPKGPVSGDCDKTIDGLMTPNAGA